MLYPILGLIIALLGSNVYWLAETAHLKKELSDLTLSISQSNTKVEQRIGEDNRKLYEDLQNAKAKADDVTKTLIESSTIISNSKPTRLLVPIDSGSLCRKDLPATNNSSRSGYSASTLPENPGMRIGEIKEQIIELSDDLSRAIEIPLALCQSRVDACYTQMVENNSGVPKDVGK